MNAPRDMSDVVAAVEEASVYLEQLAGRIGAHLSLNVQNVPWGVLAHYATLRDPHDCGSYATVEVTRGDAHITLFADKSAAARLAELDAERERLAASLSVEGAPAHAARLRDATAGELAAEPHAVLSALVEGVIAATERTRDLARAELDARQWEGART